MSWFHFYRPTLKCTQWCERDGKTKTKNSLRRLTFTEARMQLNFCWRILCILLPEAKKGSMAGCSVKRGSREKDTCILGRKAASGLTFWPSSLKILIKLDKFHIIHRYVFTLSTPLVCIKVQSWLMYPSLTNVSYITATIISSLLIKKCAKDWIEN